jgi:FAD/FMN-containing dehydrogenase
LAADSVNFFELVTPDGRLVRASQDENADLFWGLCGGGGNFGIVTGMEIRLYPVTEVYGGNLIYPIEMAREVFIRYRQWIADMPEEMTSSVVLMNYPPIPQLPEILRGRSVVMVRGCYAGAVEEGAALVDPWRSWRTPLIDDFKPMPFSAVGRISSDPVGPIAGSSTGAWLAELSDEAIDLLIEYGKPQSGPAPITKIEIRHAGGAMARVDPGVSAYGNRDATLNMQFIGITPTPEAHEAFQEHSDELKGKLHPYLTGGVYMNFLEGKEARRRTPDAYSAQTYERLVDLKAQIDPRNRMNHSFHIPPVMKLEPALA